MSLPFHYCLILFTSDFLVIHVFFIIFQCLFCLFSYYQFITKLFFSLKMLEIMYCSSNFSQCFHIMLYQLFSIDFPIITCLQFLLFLIKNKKLGDNKLLLLSPKSILPISLNHTVLLIGLYFHRTPSFYLGFLFLFHVTFHLPFLVIRSHIVLYRTQLHLLSNLVLLK